jgi:transcriptional regulator with XRE-family HTH domain
MGQKKDPRTRRHDREFGEQLFAAREQIQKTQEEMARLLGMGLDRYKKAEQGTRGFPAEYMQTLCGVTGLDANFFFRVTPAATVAEQPRAARR